MPRTRECDFCGDDIEPGTGTMFVRTNGATIHYCSSKCENNHNLGREARNLEWTEAGRPDEREVSEEPAATAETTPDPETVEDEAEAEAGTDETVEDEAEAEAGTDETVEDEAEAEAGTDETEGTGGGSSSESESETETETEEETEAEA